jgi:hypothetical protein
MPTQNFKNHARYVPLYHFITPLILIAVMIGSIINLIHSAPENIYSASLIITIAILLVIIWVYVRTFALKAQDRAIRAEENFRHFILTGKPLYNSLTMSQIIALRFASDEELAELAKRAADEKLNSISIKEAIKNWRPDHHRA